MMGGKRSSALVNELVFRHYQDRTHAAIARLVEAQRAYLFFQAEQMGGVQVIRGSW